MSHGQTKNALIDSKTAATALEHGLLVNLASVEDQVSLAVSAAKPVAGVVREWACHAQEKTFAIGDIVSVQSTGIAEVLMAAAVAHGDPVMANAAGKGVLATTGYIVGYALKASVVGEFIPVQLALTKI